MVRYFKVWDILGWLIDDKIKMVVLNEWANSGT